MSRTLKAPFKPNIPNIKVEVAQILKKKMNFDLEKEIEKEEQSGEGEEQPPDNTEMRKYKSKIPANWDEVF